IIFAVVTQWSDYSGTSNPSKDIETAKEAIRAQIGRQGNTVILSAQAMKACRQHPSIVDRIKYTGRDVVTADLLAALWG
ncbi:major capsid protein, partial [Escherichia coli]|uniref:major capsid protein n=1 Tax=Escherichia coli TaxID=562 RepID=UPI0021F35C28